jgi:hypothetical protein
MGEAIFWIGVYLSVYQSYSMEKYIEYPGG